MVNLINVLRRAKSLS
jgi:hypothetical protein